MRPFTVIGTLPKKDNWVSTYRMMIMKYASNSIAKAKQDYLQANHIQKPGSSGGGGGGSDKNPPELKPGGAPLTSDGTPFKYGSYTLLLNKDGALQIKDHKLDVVLWDSLVTDQGGGLVQGATSVRSDGVAAPPYRLQYQSDGNLVILNKLDEMIWQTQTKTSSCMAQGKGMPGKVVFDRDLRVKTQKGAQVWKAGTKGDSDPAKMPANLAPVEAFGGGMNQCITEKNCVTIWYDENFEKDGQEPVHLGPGSYTGNTLTPNFIGDINSVTVVEDNCWYRASNGRVCISVPSIAAVCLQLLPLQ